MEYCDIIVTTSPEGVADAVSGVVQGLHVVLPRAGGRVGMAFPDWREPEPESGADRQLGSLGRIIRLLGPQQDLEDIVASPSLQAAFQGGWKAVAQPIKPVPAGARPVRYVRDRTREKSFAKFERRIQARSERNGRSCKPRTARAERNVNFAVLVSRSTRQQYPLFIRREEVGKPVPGEFSRYGLARSNGPTVFDF
jgi:CRISPR-associated endoribonuclease Cas6/Csy4 subtype I-F